MLMVDQLQWIEEIDVEGLVYSREIGREDKTDDNSFFSAKLASRNSPGSRIRNRQREGRREGSGAREMPKQRRKSYISY